MQPTPFSPRRGFTLIELLIVVAIIAILAAIAVPNFLEAQTRAKVSRALADMRSLATAIEAYRVDANRYPPRPIDPANRTMLIVPTEGPLERAESYVYVTSPIAYITSIPIDPFEDDLRGVENALGYWDNYQTESIFLPEIGKGGYTQYSIGPDTAGGWGNPGFGYPPDNYPGTFRVIYDPTNGTVSLGNIYRFSANSNPPGYLDPNPGGSI